MKKGLDVPIDGIPVPKIGDGPKVSKVAIVGPDFVGMKPTMAVKVGDRVKKGQLLFTDKKSDGIRFTAPGAGEVMSIDRGEQRVFQTLVIKLDSSEDEESFSTYDPASVSRDDLVAVLNESGLWSAIRTRPFSRTPNIGSKPPAAIFVNAMDTNPLAPFPGMIIGEHESAFRDGLRALTKLSSGPLYLCVDPHTRINTSDMTNVVQAQFEGPHPAGLVGTHIHFLCPVGAERSVWHCGYQDVIAIGKLLTTGKLWTERTISLGGPSISSPRYLKTRLGACLSELTAKEIPGNADGTRIVSGSVLNGRTRCQVFDYLGRYHIQVCALGEGTKREFLGWQGPGFTKFSVKNTFAAKAIPSLRFSFTTSTEGSPRALVPVGSYESVMPLDIEPTFLLRALLAKDSEHATALGALELDEEDLGLCTFVCPGKSDYGPLLRQLLTVIERDG